MPRTLIEWTLFILAGVALYSRFLGTDELTSTAI